jgi:hypothetical protein
MSRKKKWPSHISMVLDVSRLVNDQNKPINEALQIVQQENGLSETYLEVIRAEYRQLTGQAITTMV